MDHLVNVDCWQVVLSFLRSDHHALFQLLLVSKDMFKTVIPILYRRPLLDYELHPTKREALENLLWGYATQADTPHALEATKTMVSKVFATTAAQDMTYLNFVQEMSDPYLDFSIPGVQSYLDLRATKLRIFGTKIKRIEISVNREEDLEEEHFELMPGLERLVITTYSLGWKDNPLQESVYNTVQNLVSVHRAAFPGVLKHVVFNIQTFNPLGNLTDPKMMLTIKDVMGGNWCTDTAQLRIPVGQDAHLLKVLEDVDLPKQLRVVKIAYVDTRRSSHWVQPIKRFLSRCRVLDSIVFVECQFETISWVLEEDEAIRAGTIKTTDRAQWKSVDIQRYLGFTTHDDSDNSTDFEFSVDATEWQEIGELWRIAVIGFGHCIETIRLSAAAQNGADLSPILSLPASVQLPKLRSLSVKYGGRFGELSYTGIELLRELHFKVSQLPLLDINSKWNDWKRWSNVESLVLSAPLSESAGLFRLDKPNDQTRFNVGEQSEMVDTLESRWVPKTDYMSLTSQSFQRLKFVYIEDKEPSQLGLSILLVAPNISSLTFNAVDSQDSQDWSGFFQQAVSQSLVFPNLSRLRTTNLVTLSPSDFAHLLGIAPGVDLFPALTEIVFSITHDAEGEWIDCICIDEEKCMQVVEDALKEGHGHSRNGLVYLRRQDLSRAVEKKWNEWMRNRDIKKYFDFRFESMNFFNEEN